MDKKFEDIVQSALNDSEIHTCDIPNLDLYMDQIITLIEEKYAPNKRTPDEKLLTKTMINNYSKEKLIKQVKGKKYSKEHIIQMLVIYAMKNTLTISEIKNVLDTVYNQTEFDGEQLAVCYETTLKTKEIYRRDLPKVLEQIVQQSNFDLEQPSDRFAMLLSVMAMADYMRTLAEKMVDTYFKD